MLIIDKTTLCKKKLPHNATDPITEIGVAQYCFDYNYLQFCDFTMTSNKKIVNIIEICFIG